MLAANRRWSYPDLGDFSDVEVIEVHVSSGSSVDVEDPLVTLETDKAAMDVPAVVAGTIESVLVKVGDKVSEGTSIALIDAVASAAATRGGERRKPTAPAGADTGRRTGTAGASAIAADIGSCYNDRRGGFLEGPRKSIRAQAGA